MSDGLVAFLRARLDEDQRTAAGLVNAARVVGAKPDFYGAGGPAAEAFWARFDPSRLLADIDAKRAILDLHVDRAECTRCAWFDGELYPCDTLKHLAQPYAGHEHYRKEWTP